MVIKYSVKNDAGWIWAWDYVISWVVPGVECVRERGVTMFLYCHFMLEIVLIIKWIIILWNFHCFKRYLFTQWHFLLKCFLFLYQFLTIMLLLIFINSNNLKFRDRRNEQFVSNNIFYIFLYCKCTKKKISFLAN